MQNQEQTLWIVTHHTYKHVNRQEESETPGLKELLFVNSLNIRF